MTPHRLTEAELRGLAPHGVARSYPRGTIVVAEGDSGDSLYVIVEGRVIEGRHTHQDLASRVGASREMVGRVLKDLTGGGYITLQRNRIVIHRPPPRRW